MEAATVRAPERSLEQRRAALRKAQHVRMFRARVKRDIKTGDADPAALVARPPADLLSMQVFDLLRAVPKFGRTKSNRVLVRCRVSPSKTIGGLSARQRREIVEVLAQR